jgi:hypothetical protein
MDKRCITRGPYVRVLRKDNRDRHVAEAHADGAGEHNGLAAELVDVQHCGDGGDEQCHAHDAGCEEGGRVAGCAEGGEDGGCVVEDCSSFR